MRRARLPWRSRRRLNCSRPTRTVCFSNGPGDPAPLTYAIENAKQVVDAGVPTFGIWPGHQILGLALGGRTFVEVRSSRWQTIR